MRTGWMVAVAFVAVGTSASSAQKIPSVTASGAVIDAEHGQVRVDLENFSRQRATAWALKLTVVFSDGSEASTYADVDGYTALLNPSAFPPNVLIAPGTRIAQVLAVPSKGGLQPTSAFVDVRAVIYENRSFEGDPKVAQVMFSRRKAHSDQWRAISGSLSAATNVSADRLRASLGELLVEARANAGASLQAAWLAGEVERMGRSADNQSGPALEAQLARLNDLVRGYEVLSQTHSSPAAN